MVGDWWELLEWCEEQRARQKQETTRISSGFFEWAVPGLNRGPSDFQSLALPAELTAQTSPFYKGLAIRVNRSNN
jgi:hypothetical protein